MRSCVLECMVGLRPVTKCQSEVVLISLISTTEVSINLILQYITIFDYEIGINCTIVVTLEDEYGFVTFCSCFWNFDDHDDVASEYFVYVGMSFSGTNEKAFLVSL